MTNAVKISGCLLQTDSETAERVVLQVLVPQAINLMLDAILSKFDLEHDPSLLELDLVKHTFWALDNLILCRTLEPNSHVFTETLLERIIEILSQGIAFLS